MSLRHAADDSLSTRQKLTLFHGTAISAESALALDDDSIRFEYMIENGVRAVNITAAGLRPLKLKQNFAVDSASKLRRLGFDALHLVDPVICEEANAAFGADDVLATFLVAPQDAVALAGTEAVRILNVSVERLLEVCAGAPTEAISVLQQTPDASPLKGVSVTCVLDAGLRAPQLHQLGFGPTVVAQMTCVGPPEIAKLGFRVS